MRRNARRLGGLALLLLVGCSSNDLSVDPLDSAFRRRGRGACDGFVFVPTRQAVGGTTIPHAIIEIIPLPIGPDSVPVASGQADETGFYRFEGFMLDRPYIVRAREPFGGPRQLAAVVSFSDLNEDQRRNLTDTTTLAARVVELSDTTAPLTVDQVQSIEQLAEERLSEDPDPSGIVISQAKLDELAGDLLNSSFGSLKVQLASSAPALAKIRVNNGPELTLNTVLPSRQAAGELVIDDLLVGEVTVDITADGYLSDQARVTIVAGETTVLARSLVPEPEPQVNQPPVIVDAVADPDPLGFHGGQVRILAIIRDPEDDSLRVTATIEEPDGETRTVPMEPAGDDYFRVLLDIPGNPELINQVYGVTVEATDPPHEALAGRPAALAFDFSVAGVDPPPGEP